MLCGLVGKRDGEAFARLLWQTECKEEDAINWASELAQRQQVYLQAVLVGENNKVAWGNWNPRHKNGSLYHVPTENEGYFSRECQNCTFFFGDFGINCALHPQGLSAKECADFEKKGD